MDVLVTTGHEINVLFNILINALMATNLESYIQIIWQRKTHILWSLSLSFALENIILSHKKFAKGLVRAKARGVKRSLARTLHRSCFGFKGEPKRNQASLEIVRYVIHNLSRRNIQVLEIN